MIKSTYKDYVQVFLPTKDKDDKQLCKEDIALWKKHMRKIFRKYMKGYHVSPYYRIEGDFLSSSGKWISEPNYIIKTFGPRKSCRELIKALEKEIIQQMGIALEQETIALESSIEGLSIYKIIA